MKKKKVDKILKGVVTAGVALGGASFMTEADMVYAAELGEQGEEEEFEQAGLEQDEEVESPAVEEALDTDTSSDDTTPTEEASTDETAYTFFLNKSLIIKSICLIRIVVKTKIPKKPKHNIPIIGAHPSTCL